MPDRPHEERPPLARQPSFVAVGVLSAIWAAVAVFFPGILRALALTPGQGATESPVEWLEHGLLAACIGGWAVIAWRMARSRRWLPVGLASAMVLQLVLVLGEELDWGATLGFKGPFWMVYHRNIRIFLRNKGILGRSGELVLVGYLAAFLVAPLIPVARIRAVLDRAAPVRAQREDTLALVAAAVAWLAIAAAAWTWQSPEFIQMAGYLVLAVVTVRILGNSR